MFQFLGTSNQRQVAKKRNASGNLIPPLVSMSGARSKPQPRVKKNTNVKNVSDYQQQQIDIQNIQIEHYDNILCRFDSLKFQLPPIGMEDKFKHLYDFVLTHFVSNQSDVPYGTSSAQVNVDVEFFLNSLHKRQSYESEKNFYVNLTYKKLEKIIILPLLGFDNTSPFFFIINDQKDKTNKRSDKKSVKKNTKNEQRVKINECYEANKILNNLLIILNNDNDTIDIIGSAEEYDIVEPGPSHTQTINLKTIKPSTVVDKLFTILERNYNNLLDQFLDTAHGYLACADPNKNKHTTSNVYQKSQLDAHMRATSTCLCCETPFKIFIANDVPDGSSKKKVSLRNLYNCHIHCFSMYFNTYYVLNGSMSKDEFEKHFTIKHISKGNMDNLQWEHAKMMDIFGKRFYHRIYSVHLIIFFTVNWLWSVQRIVHDNLAYFNKCVSPISEVPSIQLVVDRKLKKIIDVPTLPMAIINKGEKINIMYI